MAALLRHGAWLVGPQQRRHVNDDSSLFITVTNLLMNITYFLASFVAGRCFCIQHIDRPYDVVTNTFGIGYRIRRRMPLFINALLTYQRLT